MQLACALSVQERLLAEPIPREQQPLARAIPDGQREHALQVGDPGLALFLMEVDDHFRVAGGPEAMAGRLEAAAKLLKVVELAVEPRPDRPVFFRDRLVAAGAVDDRQPLAAQPGRAAPARGR